MNILHVGLCVDGKNEGLPYALAQRGRYYEINPGEKEVNGHILAIINQVDYKFDLAFFQIQTAGKIYPSTFQKLKEKGIFTLNWSGDVRLQTESWYKRTGTDLTCFSNMRDVNNLRAAGLKAEYLQIGIDPEVFKRHGEKRTPYDVVFMGNDYGQFPLSQERRNLVAALRNRYKSKFGLFGGYKGSNGNLNGNQLEESKVYNNCKIGINYSHFKIERYTSDRMLRIMASGAMCLSHYYPGIEQEFRIGKNIDVYHSIEEAIKKINYYLSHEEERKRIADAGYDWVHSNYTYQHMVNRIIGLYGKYK